MKIIEIDPGIVVTVEVNTKYLLTIGGVCFGENKTLFIQLAAPAENEQELLDAQSEKSIKITAGSLSFEGSRLYYDKQRGYLTLDLTY